MKKRTVKKQWNKINRNIDLALKRLNGDNKLTTKDKYYKKRYLEFMRPITSFEDILGIKKKNKYGRLSNNTPIRIIGVRRPTIRTEVMSHGEV